MSSRVPRTLRRCWLCTEAKPTGGGMRVTVHRHWICANCGNRKVYQIADWLLDAIPAAQRGVVLAGLKLVPRINAPAADA